MPSEAATLTDEEATLLISHIEEQEANPAPKPVPSGRERRQWKRFKIDGAFAAVPKPMRIKIRLGKSGRPGRIKLGPVKDIGMKGLAVQYVSSRAVRPENDSLSVIVPGEGAVDDIQYTAVNDFEVTRLPDSDKSIRTLCVCFKRLLPFQRARLEHLIERYGVELK